MNHHSHKYKFRALFLALCCAASLSLPTFAEEVEARSGEAMPDEAAYFGSGDIALRGLYVDSAFNRDFPATSDSTAAVLGGLADEIVTFAKQQQFNTLIYPVSPRADAVYRSNYLPSSRYVVSEEGGFILSDPLDVLVETAEMERMNVVITLSPFYAGEVGDTYAEDSPVTLHPDWFITIGKSLYFNPNIPEAREFWVNVVTELVNGYNLDGIALSDLDVLGDGYYEGIRLLVEQCMYAIHSRDSSLSAGISLSHEAIDSPQWKELLEVLTPHINFVLPEMAVSVDSETSYRDYLEQWTSLFADSEVRIYTVNEASRLRQPLINEVSYGDRRELSYQLYSNSLSDCDGFAIHSYRDVSGLNKKVADELNLVGDSIPAAVQSLNQQNDTVFSVADSGSTVRTIYTRYYLSGHCDPNQPLFINGEEVDSSYINKKGYWGITFDLERGSNVFAVRQGDKTRRVVVYSSIQSINPSSKIDDIQEDSVFPGSDEILFEGEPLTLSCIAPYGGDVMCMFQGNTYHLLPPEGLTEEDIGRAVEYRLEVPLISRDSTQTENLGKINYFLTYGNFSTKYRSEGNIYLVGSSSRLAVEVTDTVGRVLQSLEQDTVISNLPTGACDYAYSSPDPDYFRLYSGGYIHKKDVKVIEGAVDIQHSIEAVGVQSHEQGENLIFVGGSGLPYYSSFNEHSHTLIFQLNNVVNMPASLSHLSSKLFDSISVVRDEHRGTCTIRLHLAEGQKLWGYQVAYEDGNLHLKCKSSPVLSNDPTQPLKGVSFVLDAAYGGVENGKKTILGKYGPLEKEINLAYAQSLRRHLEELGADVTLTRSDDSTMDEEDRTLYSAYKDADFYISFRSSSTESNSDGRSQSGLSVSFDTELASGLGNRIYRQLPELLGIPANDILSSDPVITKVPLAKAVCISPGVLTNPDDYQRMTDPLEIYRSSCHLADLLIQYIRTF